MTTTEELKEQREYLKNIIRTASERITRSPEGGVTFASSHGYTQYILIRQGERYLSKRKDQEIIRTYLQKRYDIKVLKTAMEQLEALEKFLSVWNPDFFSGISQRYPDESRALLSEFQPFRNKEQKQKMETDAHDIEFARNLIDLCNDFISSKKT